MSGTPVIVLRFTIDEQPFALPICEDATLGLTPREHMRIAELCGVRLGINALLEAVQEFYPPVLTALAVVAAERAGAKLDADAVFGGKSSLTFDAETEGPPPEAEPPSRSASPTSNPPASGGAPS